MSLSSDSSLTCVCEACSFCLLLRSFVLFASSSSELPASWFPPLIAEALRSWRACQALPLALILKQMVDEDDVEEDCGGLAGEPEEEEEEEEKELAKAEGGPGLCL